MQSGSESSSDTVDHFNCFAVVFQMSHAATSAFCRSIKLQCELYPSREVAICLDPYCGLGFVLWCLCRWGFSSAFSETRFPLYCGTTECMMWVMKGWEEQPVPLGVPQAVGIAGSCVEAAVWRMWFVWAGHGPGCLDLEEQSISTAIHWPPAALLLSLQSLACFIWWKQCFTNITLRKWFPLFYSLSWKQEWISGDSLIYETFRMWFLQRQGSVFSCRCLYGSSKVIRKKNISGEMWISFFG